MSGLINTVLVDDEINCLSAIRQLVQNNCPDLIIVGEADSVKSAIRIIEVKRPKLVFLDVRMPDGDGFTVLEKVKFKDFDVIFTTAHEEYAIKAFDFSAIHYLLKPVAKKALVEAVQKFNKIHNNKELLNSRLGIIKESLNQNHNRIMLPSMEGFAIYEINSILRCEADGCYTKVFIENIEKPVMVSNSIGNYERLLSDLNFCRVHNKHLVNLKHVFKFLKAYGGMLQMNDGTEIKVSERKRNFVLDKLKNLARSC